MEIVWWFSKTLKISFSCCCFYRKKSSQITVVIFVVAVPIFRGCVWLGIFFPHCTHLLQSAHLRLRTTAFRCMLSTCFGPLDFCSVSWGSLTSVHDLKCMRTQKAPLFNVPRGIRGTTTRVVHPYPCGPSQAGNQTRFVAREVPSAIGPASNLLMMSIFMSRESKSIWVFNYLEKVA